MCPKTYLSAARRFCSSASTDFSSAKVRAFSACCALVEAKWVGWQMEVKTRDVNKRVLM